MADSLDLDYTQSRNNAPDLLDQALLEVDAAEQEKVETDKPEVFSFSEAVKESSVAQLGMGVTEGLRQTSLAMESITDDFGIPSIIQFTDEQGNFDLDLVFRKDIEKRGDQKVLDIFPETEKPEDFAPNLARGVGQFLSGFIGPFKALKRAGVGTGTAAVTSGAVADALAFDPKEPRVSNFLEELGIDNAVTDFLKTNPEDSDAEGRMKNAIEGAALGKIGETLTTGLVKAFKGFRSQKSLSGELDETALKEAEESTKAIENIELKVGKGKTEVVEVKEGDIALDDIRGDEVPSKAVNINLRNLNTPDDIKNIINKVGEAFEPDIQTARREKITLEQTEKLADDLGMTVETLLERRQGEAFNAETVVASRKILVSSAAKVRELASEAMGTEATAEGKAAFLRAMSVHKAIQQQVSGLTAEAGRALGAFRIVAGQDVNLALENIPVEDMARIVSQQDTMQGLNHVTRELDKATTGDMMIETWINGLLSSPATHAVNIMSNAMVNLWSIPERFLASGFGKLAGNQEVPVGEVVQMMFGLKEGYKDGLTAAAKVIKTGEALDPLTKLDVRQQKAVTGENLNLTGTAGRAADFLGEAIRIPGRFLTAEDSLFKSVNYRMELNALAFRQATQEGLSGKAAATRMKEITLNPPANIVKEATQFSRVQTFTNELGETGRAVQRLANSHPAAKIIMPFVRTPVNIVKMVGVRSPLAPFAKSVREDIAAGGARRDLALAKMASGSMMMVTAASMAGEGRITGGGPSNPSLKKILRDTGWQPYSIVVEGDDGRKQYFSYSRLDPIGMTIGMAADYSEIIGSATDADAIDISSALVMSTAKNLTSKTYMSGLTTFLGAIDQSTIDPQKGSAGIKRWIQRFAVSTIPFTSALGQTSRVMDPTLRDTDGILQAMKARIPGYSKDLPARLNMWGEEIILQGGLGPDMISPIYFSQGKESPVSTELWNQRLPLGMPSRAIKGVKLTSQEYHDFIKLTAEEGIHNQLKSIIKSRDYERLTDGPEGQKSTVLRSIINASREQARFKITQGDAPEFRDLRQRIREAG